MKIKYVGNRPVVSIMCSGRTNYVFFKDNGYTQEVNDPQHVGQILRSVQHKFETFDGIPKVKADEVLIPTAHHAIAEPTDIKPPKVEKPKNEKKKVKQLNVSGRLK